MSKLEEEIKEFERKLSTLIRKQRSNRGGKNGSLRKDVQDMCKALWALCFREIRDMKNKNHQKSVKEEQGMADDHASEEENQAGTANKGTQTGEVSRRCPHGPNACPVTSEDIFNLYIGIVKAAGSVEALLNGNTAYTTVVMRKMREHQVNCMLACYCNKKKNSPDNYKLCDAKSPLKCETPEEKMEEFISQSNRFNGIYEDPTPEVRAEVQRQNLIEVKEENEKLSKLFNQLGVESDEKPVDEENRKG